MSNPTWTAPSSANKRVGNFGNTSVSAKVLDKSSRMSAQFNLVIDTTRAEKEFRKVDDAIARIKSLNTQNRAGAQSRFNSRAVVPKRARGSKKDNSSMVVLVGNAFTKVETKAQAAMAEAMKAGYELAVLEVVTAYTPYGYERFSRGQGKGAGRHDDGDMVEGLGWNVSKKVNNMTSRGSNRGGSNVVQRKNQNIVRGGSRIASITGWFGWEAPQLYQVAQEKGFRHARAGTAKNPRRRAQAVPGRVQVSSGFVTGALALGRSMLAARDQLIRELKRM